jgi:hypothetical protein
MSKEGKSKTLTMAAFSGLFIIGVVEGGNKLVNPRIFNVVPAGFDEEGLPVPAKIQMSPLPALPPFISFNKADFSYQVPEEHKPFYSLYETVTNPGGEIPPGIQIIK